MIANKKHFSSLKIISIVLTLLMFINNVSLCQQERLTRQKPTIAVVDFEAIEGLSSGEAKSLSDAFSSQLVKSNSFIVVERGKIKTILDEQGFQQSEACSAVECAIEVGKILKAEMIVTGRIGKVGRYFNVTIQTISVSTAQILFTSNEAVGDIEELLLNTIPAMATDMILQLTGKKSESSIEFGRIIDRLSVNAMVGYLKLYQAEESLPNQGYAILLTASLGEITKGIVFNTDIRFSQGIHDDLSGSGYKVTQNNIAIDFNIMSGIQIERNLNFYLGAGIGYENRSANYFYSGNGGTSNNWGYSYGAPKNYGGINLLAGTNYKIISHCLIKAQFQYLYLAKVEELLMSIGIGYSFE